MINPILGSCCALTIFITASAFAAGTSGPSAQQPSSKSATTTNSGPAPTNADIAKLQTSVADLQKTVKSLQNSLDALQTKFANHHHTTNIGCIGVATITPAEPPVPVLVRISPQDCAPDQAQSSGPL